MSAVNTSAEGGESHLASGWKIYNELAQTRPDVLGLLAMPNWATEGYDITNPNPGEDDYFSLNGLQ